MEALSGMPAKDELNFAYIGMSNHPFIKANYPHHEEFWGWGAAVDQVVLMIPYIQRSMVECEHLHMQRWNFVKTDIALSFVLIVLAYPNYLDHDILADLEFPTEWVDPKAREEVLYKNEHAIESMYEWRDLQVMGKMMSLHYHDSAWSLGAWLILTRHKFDSDECHWYG